MLLDIFYTCTILLGALRSFEANNSLHPRPFKSCFEELGCISTNDLWYHETKRPFNLEPLDRHTIRTDFIFFKKNETDQLIYDMMTAKNNSIDIAGFVKNEPVIILIHDFTSNGFTGWIKHYAGVALRETPNIVSVDWEPGAEPPYAQAVANARVVALEIILFIKALTNFGICANGIKIVGHGVGAHIAGYVGAEIKGINKIIGLDPSGPYFEGMPNEVKLNKGSAHFVEVIHTDAFNIKSQGTRERMGHIDFYANNAGIQPGCEVATDYIPITKVDRNSLKEGQILPDCSHKRSFKYFIEALERPECQFLGIPCPDHQQFLEGKCTSCNNGNSKCVFLGVESSRIISNNKLFFNTRDRKPFCMFTYIMEITISTKSKHQMGKFEMMLVGDGDKVSNATSASGEHVMKYEPGKTYSQIFYASPFRIQNITEAEVKWMHKKGALCVLFCDNDIYVKEVVVKFLTKRSDCQASTSLCPIKGEKKITTGAYMKFVKCKGSGS